MRTSVLEWCLRCKRPAYCTKVPRHETGIVKNRVSLARRPGLALGRRFEYFAMVEFDAKIPNLQKIASTYAFTTLCILLLDNNCGYADATRDLLGRII